ncbi:acyclic terpene utilization AtuA family protein [Streptomyces sp. NPDC001530]|uniref:acyclic terpene utilization AtuA family protein n=1 Tax=Streptomyces sp. NPDC001530 TaxID=3364582 RepID=UPI0036D0B55A
MTSASERGKRPLRVGNCSGFYGDRASAMADMARAGGIDVLTGDYLAEVTMLILGKARAKDSTKGFATTFLQHLDAALEHLVANRIRLVVNAGGLNPAGLAAATRELIARHGHDLRVSHIEGDDVFASLGDLRQAGHCLPHLTSGQQLSDWPHQPLTANAYLGGFGIARALHNGADIVVTGRVTDASLVVGPAAWWWGWTPDDHDALAGAVAAGHVIECGPQATGGNFSGFRSVPDLVEPGFPIAEIAGDGSSVITKNPGTGGVVTQDTVTAQLLYEIGEPAYLNPDVTAHLDTATLTDLGEDRVGIRGVRGTAPSRTTKVAITGVGGWTNSAILALTGTDLDAKAALVEQFVHRYAEAVNGLDAVAVERIGRAQPDPDTQNAGTELLRITVQGTQLAAGRVFSSRVVELALSSYPGLYSLGPPQPGSAFGVYWPALLDQRMLQHTVHHYDGTTEIIAPGNPDGAGGEVMPQAEPALAPSVPAPRADELVVAPLGEIVHARSGDKGGDANLGVWVRDRAAWDWLRSTLTVDELRRLLPETRGLEISRHELPYLGAVNFLVRGLLGAGATSTLRLDSQAKALGEWLRSRSIKVPRSLVRS